MHAVNRNVKIKTSFFNRCFHDCDTSVFFCDNLPFCSGWSILRIWNKKTFQKMVILKGSPAQRRSCHNATYPQNSDVSMVHLSEFDRCFNGAKKHRKVKYRCFNGALHGTDWLIHWLRCCACCATLRDSARQCATVRGSPNLPPPRSERQWSLLRQAPRILWKFL